MEPSEKKAQLAGPHVDREFADLRREVRFLQTELRSWRAKLGTVAQPSTPTGARATARARGTGPTEHYDGRLVYVSRLPRDDEDVLAFTLQTFQTSFQVLDVSVYVHEGFERFGGTGRMYAYHYFNRETLIASFALPRSSSSTVTPRWRRRFRYGEFPSSDPRRTWKIRLELRRWAHSSGVVVPAGYRPAPGIMWVMAHWQNADYH